MQNVNENFYDDLASILQEIFLKKAQCIMKNWQTLGQYKSDNNNRMIQLTDVHCVLLRYKWASNFWLQ